MILVVNNAGKDVHFLHKILDCLRKYHYPYQVVRSKKDMDQLTKQIQSTITGIILSGSPVSTESYAGHQELMDTNWYIVKQFPSIPILGICFGCQFLNMVAGGTLQRFRQPVQKTIPVLFSGKQKGYSHEFQFFCHYGPKEIPSPFRALAHATMDGQRVPCMIRHKTLPIFGTLFHPEFHAKTHWILEQYLDVCVKPQSSVDVDELRSSKSMDDKFYGR